MALAEGKYSEAFENFQSVTKLDPENSSVCFCAFLYLVCQMGDGFHYSTLETTNNISKFVVEHLFLNPHAFQLVDFLTWLKLKHLFRSLNLLYLLMKLWILVNYLFLRLGIMHPYRCFFKEKSKRYSCVLKS